MAAKTLDPNKKRDLFDAPRKVDHLLHGFYGVRAELLHPLPGL